MAYLIYHGENFERGTGHDVYWFNGYGHKLIKNFRVEKRAWNFVCKKLGLPQK